MENEMKLEFKSNPCNEAFASATVINFISQLNPSLEEMNDIKICVSEAVRNSIIHAYDSTAGVIQLKYELDTRKELVDKYGYYSNVTFYSDGSVFISGSRIGVNGWIGRTPPLPEGEIPPT